VTCVESPGVLEIEIGTAFVQEKREVSRFKETGKSYCHSIFSLGAGLHCHKRTGVYAHECKALDSELGASTGDGRSVQYLAKYRWFRFLIKHNIKILSGWIRTRGGIVTVGVVMTLRESLSDSKDAVRTESAKEWDQAVCKVPSQLGSVAAVFVVVQTCPKHRGKLGSTDHLELDRSHFVVVQHVAF